MGQVSVTLNGRTYRLECGEGEEAHLIALSEYLASHMETMKHKFGQVGDDRLILMASLMVTDELWDDRSFEPVLRAFQKRFAETRTEEGNVMATVRADAIDEAYSSSRGAILAEFRNSDKVLRLFEQAVAERDAVRTAQAAPPQEREASRRIE